MYISLKDGRRPVIDDYDLKSEMEGADSIALTSKLSIWKEKAWDFKDGVAVVVAVKRSSIVVPFSVLLLD